MPLVIGENFAGYTILRLLGSGGMGEVYQVQHPRLPRQEALKVLRPDFSQDPSFRERFIREADLASGLRHPHIVGIHDRGEHDGHLWIAMEFIDGTDLSHLLEHRYTQGMPVGHVLPIMTAVASALDYAHKKGLLHRDVKPANIIVADLDNDDPKTFLADFGIARPLDDTSGITTTNMTVGTVAYAAPEQLMGEQMDGRADQYALAATCYHMLTGLQPFPHSNPAVVISRHLNAPAPTLLGQRPELATLDTVLAAALAKNPTDRFAICSDFAKALNEVNAAHNPHAAAPTIQAPAVRKPSGSTDLTADNSGAHREFAGSTTRWWVVGGAVAVLVVLVIAGLWQPWRPSQSNSAGSSSSTPTTSPIVTATTTAEASPAPVPPPVTVTVTPPASTTAVVSGPTIGDQCDDWMKFSTDSTTGQEMVCGGAPDDPTTTWQSTASGMASGMANLPRVGASGSACSAPPYTFGRSSDGYAVWCVGGGSQAVDTPVWTKYRP